MNREILFRGKSGQTWYYGFLTGEKHYIGAEGCNNWTYRWHIYTEDKDTLWVREDTIGQYTGLVDSKQNKIFEGDIITFEDICCEDIPGYECPDEWAVDVMNKAEIVIREGCICFGKTLFQTSVYEDIRLHYPNIQKWFTECTKVIGNVYDNAELLERNNL